MLHRAMKYVNTEKILPYPIPIKSIMQSTQFLSNFYNDTSLLEKDDLNYYSFFIDLETFPFITDVNIIPEKNITAAEILRKIDYIKKLKIDLSRDCSPEIINIIVEKSIDIEELSIDASGLGLLFESKALFRNLKKLTIIDSESYSIFNFSCFAPNMEIFINNNKRAIIYINQDYYKKLHTIWKENADDFSPGFYFLGKSSNIINMNVDIRDSKTNFPLVKTWINKGFFVSMDSLPLKYLPNLENLHISFQIFNLIDIVLYEVKYLKFLYLVSQTANIDCEFFSKLKTCFPNLEILDLSEIKYSGYKGREKIEIYPEYMESVIIEPEDNFDYSFSYILEKISQTNVKNIYRNMENLLNNKSSIEIRDDLIFFRDMYPAYVNVEIAIKSQTIAIIDFQSKFTKDDILKNSIFHGKTKTLKKIWFMNMIGGDYELIVNDILFLHNQIY